MFFGAELVTRGPYLRNLVALEFLTHTRLTYHRTWETGLRVAIRVTAFSPAFFCPDSPSRFSLPKNASMGCMCARAVGRQNLFPWNRESCATSVLCNRESCAP